MQFTSRQLRELVLSPSAVVSSPAQRIRSRLLATMLFVVAGVCVVGGTVFYFVLPNYLPTYQVQVAGLVVMAVLFVLNRRGYFSTVSVAFIAVGAAVAFGMLLSSPTRPFVAAYTAGPILLAGMLLSVRGTLVVALLTFMGLTAAVLWSPVGQRYATPLAPLMFTVFTSALVIIGVWYRDALEAMRQKDLVDSEHRYEVATGAADDVIWEWDIANSRVAFNGLFYNRFGYDEDSFDTSGVALNDLLHPTERDGVQEAMRQHLAGETDRYRFEYRLRAADGNYHWVSGTGLALRNDRGEAVTVVGTMRDISDRKEAEAAEHRQTQLLSAVFDNTQVLAAYMDTAFNFLLVNRAYAAVEQKTPEYFLGKNHFDLYPNEENEALFRRVVETGEPYHALARPFTYSNEPDRGTSHWDWTLTPIRDAAGEVSGLVLSLLDVTERMKSAAVQTRLASALDQTADSVVITDRRGVIEYVNPAFEKTTGYTRDEAVGNKPNLVKSGKHDPEFYQNLWNIILRGEVFRDVFINRTKEGFLYYEEKTITPLKDEEGGIVSFISTGKDITKRVQTEERLHHLAHHDVVTNLPNRVMFMERLSHALGHGTRTNRFCAVMFLDLDRFKNINDTLGHDVGDQLLQAVAERLKSCVRRGDTVARLGGDEFTVLLEDVASDEDIAPIARKILASLSQPFRIGRHELFTSASVGISLYPGDGNDATTLLKNADAAMYRAKERGRNGFEFYSAELGERALHHLNLETALRRALERNEYYLEYQPQIDLHRGRPVGVEALLRWRRPDGEVVSPAEFIPVLEDTGLIVAVGRWVLGQACRDMARWRDAGLAVERCAVNLSGRQVDDHELLKSIEDALRANRLPATCLELEITESLLLQNADHTLKVLEAISAMGIRLAIDDFGTGYSSLSYLRRFPIDNLKIDRSFVSNMSKSAEDAEIVKAIIAMAKSLRIEVIAEGVETRKQEAFLRAHGCLMMQGFLYARPVAATTIDELFLGASLARTGD